jgi:hypothetical protein
MKARKGHLLFGLFFLILLGCQPKPIIVTEAVPENKTTSTSTLVPTINTPTSVVTSTQTPVPINLTLHVLGADGNPVMGAVITAAEYGKVHAITDADGFSTLANLPSKQISLIVAAQGYLRSNQPVILTSGSNDVEVVLEIDPFGLQISKVLKEGETLLFIEDFQDGKEEFLNVVGDWQIIDDPDEPGNKIIKSISNPDLDYNLLSVDVFDQADVIVQYRFRYVDLDNTNENNYSGFTFREKLVMDVAPYWNAFQVIDMQGEWTFPFQVSGFGYRSDYWYTMRIEAVGSRATLYLNGSTMGRANGIREDAISADIGGNWEMNVHAGPGAGVMYFDDIVIIQPAP